jgi:integrase
MERANINAKLSGVETWLNSVAFSHSGSKSTYTEYKRNFLRFCDYIGKTPEEILAEYETVELNHVPERTLRRKYSQYLQSWIIELSGQGFVSGTIHIMVGSVQSFFKYNDLALGHVPIGKRKVTFHNRDITKEDILQILSVSAVREKAFYLVMAQSGLRPHTICALRYKNIQPDFDNGIMPCCIRVSEDITKGAYRAYFSFIGDDAVNALRDYLKTRKMEPESLLFTQKGSGTYDPSGKWIPDKPLDRRVITHFFRAAIMKLKQKGLVDYRQKAKGKAGTVRLYSLRKYFRKQAGQAGLDYAQFWMGHILKNQDEHYFKPQEDSEEPFSKEAIETHRKMYAEKAAPHLRLETATPSETEKTIQEQQTEIERLKQELEKTREQTKGIQEIREELEKFRYYNWKTTMFDKIVWYLKLKILNRYSIGDIIDFELENKTVKDLLNEPFKDCEEFSRFKETLADAEKKGWIESYVVRLFLHHYAEFTAELAKYKKLVDSGKIKVKIRETEPV